MQNRFVLPGDRIGSLEEYVPGHDTYVMGGCIYASTAGDLELDSGKKSASVVPRANAPPRLRNGDIVVGEVIDLKENLVILSLAFKKGYEKRPLANDEATIHISNVRNAYVKDIRQMFGLRDIVKAKIIDDRQLRLYTGEDDLGVIKAYCGRCMAPMFRKNQILQCPSCNNTESRKLSTQYGLGTV